MNFPFNIYALAFCSAFAVSLLTFPLWRKWCVWTGHVDSPGRRKIHSSPTPLAGGLTVMTGFFLPLLAGAAIVSFWSGWNPQGAVHDLLGYGLSRRAGQIAAILGGAMGMVILGWLDDRIELKPGAKFGGQLVCALIVALSGVRITLFIHSEPINYGVTILWILALTNAFNFLDNMNGLCSGLGIIAAWCCAWTAAIHGQYLVALLAFLICGAVAGFFPFNFPAAKAFLGDAGSHLIGFLISILAILPSFYSRGNDNRLAVISPLLILAVPLFDLISVIYIRIRTGQPVYLGDNNHVSHRLVRRGHSRARAVLILLLINAATGAATLMTFVR